MNELCDARIRPFPGSSEIECGLPGDHDGKHEGVLRDYAYPGSATTIGWLPDDRRSFVGAWPGPCATAGCILPAGHPRGHHVE